MDPGDEILVSSPFFSPYRRDALIAGGRLVPVPTSEQDNFEVDPDEIEQCISSKTKAILINSPHNSTGNVLSRGTLERIAELSKRHDLVIIADELYEKWVYDGYEHHSIGSFPGMRERTITIQGFSKTYSIR